MLRLTTSLFVFVSGYMPLFVLLAIKDMKADSPGELNHPTPVFALLGVGFLSTILTFVALHQVQGQFQMSVTRIGNRSSEITNYTLPYILSFVGFDLATWQSAVSLATLFALLFVLSVRTQSVLLNPLLALAGYGLYDIEFVEGHTSKSAIFLSRISPRVGGTYQFVGIAKFLFLLTDENP